MVCEIDLHGLWGCQGQTQLVSTTSEVTEANKTSAIWSQPSWPPRSMRPKKILLKFSYRKFERNGNPRQALAGAKLTMAGDFEWLNDIYLLLLLANVCSLLTLIKCTYFCNASSEPWRRGLFWCCCGLFMKFTYIERGWSRRTLVWCSASEAPLASVLLLAPASFIKFREFCNY